MRDEDTRKYLLELSGEITDIAELAERLKTWLKINSYFLTERLTPQSWLRRSGSPAGEPRGQCISFGYSRTRRHRVNYTISYRAAVAVAVRINKIV